VPRLIAVSLTEPQVRGWSAPMLMALSGHENLCTLGIYVNPSDDAVADALARQDPGRRR
jgi:hypothetical protein